MSEAGVHRPHVGGIHGRSNDGSYSLVLAGGFEDEVVGFSLPAGLSSHMRTTGMSHWLRFCPVSVIICGRTGEMSSPTLAVGVATSRETNGLESTVLTKR